MNKKLENTKITRFKYFQVVLNLPSESNEDVSNCSDTDLLDHMYRSGFVNQKNLENTLTSLKLESKNTYTKITNFVGQLERGKKHKKPHWQLFIETEKQTTKIKIVKALSQSLFQKDSHFSIQVTPIVDKDFSIEYVTKEGVLVLPDTEWFPGIINKQLTDFRKLLEKDKILADILEKNPRIYQKYLLKILKSEPDDRQIYWVMDFHGRTGKSKFVKAAEKSGLAISLTIDTPRSFSKKIIFEAQNYQNKFSKEPPAVLIDLSRQVPETYLDGFYGILEELKNASITSTFQGCSKYEWEQPPHVMVFANMPPLLNSLSADRFVILEILNEDYDYAIRRAVCEPAILRYNSTHVEFMYYSSQASLDQVRKMTRNQKFQFSDEELAFEQIKNKRSNNDYDIVAHYVGASDAIIRTKQNAPQVVISSMMAKEEENKDIYKK